MKFLFPYEQVRRANKLLSGGERTRLQLLLLMLQQPNLLVLDEPTNHLDIDSVEALEAALEEFQGTVCVISHDRYFLDRIVDRIVEVGAGGPARTRAAGRTGTSARVRLPTWPSNSSVARRRRTLRPVREVLELLETGPSNSLLLGLAWLAGRSSSTTRTSAKAAVRRAEPLLAAGGDPAGSSTSTGARSA